MTIIEKLAQIRTQIAKNKKERETIEMQRRSRKEVAAHIETMICHWSKEADRMGNTNAARAAAGKPAEFLTVHARGMTPSGPVSLSIDLGPLAVMLLGAEAVRKATTQTLETVPEGLGPLVRMRRLHELGEALHLASIEEESLIREAEESGTIVPYRPDANPVYALTHMPGVHSER